MSEKESSNLDPDSSEAVDRSEETIPESEVPTLPDVSRPDTEIGRSDSAICPSCGAEIPPEAPRGLCPKCALAGAAVPTDVDSLGGRSRSGQRFEPPEIETVAAAFPLLEIVELIGCGGMGAVYKARQPHLDRFVALKILPPSLAEIPGFTDRFTREGRLLAKLSHPAIVGVHDFGQGGGFFFLMMEYVDGVNLRQAMRAGRFTPEQALEIVPKVCEALQFAHDEGVLHRDIKPENILLDSKGVVKIADFGIAKLLDEAAGADPTLTGSMAPGTPHYMAPEQIEHPGTVDHRADIYSLGVVFYEMLTGELPIGRFAAPSERAAVDSQIDEIVFRSLEKERDRRQQSAGEVKTEIEGVPVAAIASERHPGFSIPREPREGRPRSSGGRKAAIIVFAGFLLPLLLNLIFMFVLLIEQRESEEQRALAEVTRTKAAKNLEKARAELGKLESSLLDMTEVGEREAAQQQMAAMKAQADRFASEMERFREYPAEVVTEHRSWFWIWAPFGSLTLLGILLIGIGIPGTIMGWTSLRRIRALDLPEGRIPPMFAALFFPLLLMGILVFALIALPMSFGPMWVAALGVSLSVIVAAGLSFLVIRAVLRWMKSPVLETERDAILAGFNRTRNPWVVGLIVVAVLLLAVMVIPVAFYFRIGGGGFLPGVIELVIVAAIVGFFVFLIWILARGARSRHQEVSAAEVGPSTPPANPWPRRVFWLILLIFVVPVLLILLSLMLPWLAYQKTPAETHSARILESVEQDHSVTIKLETRRFGNENVNVAVIYEGPKADNQSNDHDRIFPGQGQEWNLFGDERRRMNIVTFALPDRETTEKAAREIARVMRGDDGRTANFHDKRRIDLFNVPAGPSDAWRAWIEMRPGPVVSASSPPIESLLVGDWQLDADEEGGEGKFADLIVSFSSERGWSMRTRSMGAAPISGGVWNLRGGGRLELETFESTTASDIGKSEHLTIESIDDSTLVIRGQVEDDPDELMTYVRRYPPPQPIDAGQ